MINKDIALAYLARILLWLPLPITQKWGKAINTKILARFVVDCVNNYKKALELRDTDELKDNPFWIIGCSLSALLALLPVALIYGAVKSAEGKPK